MNCLVYICLLFFCNSILCQNIIQNPGFEDSTVRPWHDWPALFRLRSDDVHSGNHSLEITYRGRTDHGIMQNVNLKPGGLYKFTAYFKQSDGRHGNAGYKLFQTYEAFITYRGHDRRIMDRDVIARRPFIQFGTGWLALEGLNQVTRNFSSTDISIGGPESDIDFLLDDVFLEEVDVEANWKTEADARIEQIRKSTVHVQVSHPPSYAPQDIIIKVDQKRHLFGFGCRVNQDWIVDPNYKQYQDIFYSMFNWATLDGFEWMKSEQRKGHPNYQTTMRAVDELLNHGLQLRGHAVFWGVEHKYPNWLENMDALSLKTAIHERLTTITNMTRGKISHWDVNNELLHGQAFEEMTKDPDISQFMYNLVHQMDPSAKLFLNDFNVVAGGGATQVSDTLPLCRYTILGFVDTDGYLVGIQQVSSNRNSDFAYCKAYVDLANKFLSANVGLYGLGAECHIDYNPKAIKRNLDELSNTSLPVWISELKVRDTNESLRSDWLSKALRLYFSHPSVEGVTLWGFWDADSGKDSSLVDGSHFHVNEAGRQYLDLVQHEWSTHESFDLTLGPIHPLKAFQGDYDVTVYYKGAAIKQESFHLGKTDMMYKIDITGGENTVHIPTTIDPFSHEAHLHVTHTPTIPTGTLTTGADNSDLQCTTRWSSLSEFGVVAETHVGCNGDEILTGCSSLDKDGDWHRGGEVIEMRSAKITCSAKALTTTTIGVYAVARCCKVAKMTCSYWSSRLKSAVMDQDIEADCPSDHLATGCSLYHSAGSLYDSYPSENLHSCVTFKPQKVADTTMSVSCCKAPQLNCKRVMSNPSGLNKGDNSTTSCDDGFVMTGCNASSYSGKTAGAFIEDGTDGKDYCVATNGVTKSSGEEGTVAVAVCCKVDTLTLPLVG